MDRHLHPPVHGSRFQTVSLLRLGHGARKTERPALRAVDLLFIAFHLTLSAVILIFPSRVPFLPFLLAYNAALILVIPFIAGKASEARGGIYPALHLFYPALFIVPTYKQIYLLVPAVRPGLYDHVLIAADRFIFGGDPSAALHRIANPVLTEFLQVSYASFYFLPLLLILSMARKGRREAMEYVIFCVVYGFFLSYLGYFILPAVGPRFSLHDFTAIDTDLPGLFLTGPIRDFVNWGASASSGDPGAVLVVQRDVFPSGHTLVTLVTLYSAFRLRTRLRFVLFPVGVLLIVSTVYLRYHYGVDVVGGFVFFLFTMGTGRLIYNGRQKRRGLPPFRWDRS